MKSWLREHGFTAFLGMACVALSSQVVLLARENRALKASHAAERGPSGLFRAGETFPPFELRTADGARTTVEFEGSGVRTLLFVSAEACPICPQIVPRWEEIAPHFLAEGTRVLGVLLDRAAEPGDEWIADVPLGSFADLSRVPLSKLKAVPLTILVDAGGAIEWVHYGTLTDARLGELMAHL
jgi:hypothetical protein